MDAVMDFRLTPEGCDLGVGHQDTAEEDEDTDKERVDKSGKDGIGSVGGNELSDTGVEEFVECHLEVDGTSGVGGVAEANDGVPGGQLGSQYIRWEKKHTKEPSKGRHKQ